MRRHPVIGYDMIEHVSFLHDALVVRHHHERWDGHGYPDGLSGCAIPVGARIFAIVDAFDAITSGRPYDRGSSTQEALLRIKLDAGIHFDPLPGGVIRGNDVRLWRQSKRARRQLKAGCVIQFGFQARRSWHRQRQINQLRLTLLKSYPAIVDGIGPDLAPP